MKTIHHCIHGKPLEFVRRGPQGTVNIPTQPSVFTLLLSFSNYSLADETDFQIALGSDPPEPSFQEHSIISHIRFPPGNRAEATLLQQESVLVSHVLTASGSRSSTPEMENHPVGRWVLSTPHPGPPSRASTLSALSPHRGGTPLLHPRKGCVNLPVAVSSLSDSRPGVETVIHHCASIRLAQEKLQVSPVWSKHINVSHLFVLQVSANHRRPLHPKSVQFQQG